MIQFNVHFLSELHFRLKYIFCHPAEFPFYCFDLYTMPLDGHPGNYNFGLLTNRTNCTFLDASKSIAAVDFGSIFPPNATATTGGNNATTRDAQSVIRLPLFDLATYISLNLPMQSFNIVDIFDPEKATFEDVVDCSSENERLTVRDVVQESRLSESAGDLILNM